MDFLSQVLEAIYDWEHCDPSEKLEKREQMHKLFSQFKPTPGVSSFSLNNAIMAKYAKYKHERYKREMSSVPPGARKT